MVPELIMTAVDISGSPSTSICLSNPARGPSHPSLPVLLHSTFSAVDFQQTRDAPKGEKVLPGGRGSETGFLLPPPFFCSHYGTDILLPQHRKQRTGLKGPSSLRSSRNCLWHCLSSVIIQLCPVTSSCPNSCYQSGTGEREVRGTEERWSHYRADRAVRMERGDGLAITWPERKHTSYWIDLSLRVMDLLVHHFCYIAGHSKEIVSGN